jgi:hypothetical protein
MVDLNQIRKSVEVVRNTQGQSVVQIPLDMWESLLAEIEVQNDNNAPTNKTRNEGLLQLIQDWRSSPDDTPQTWWDEFDEFLRENPLRFTERDLKLGDDE